VNVQHFGLKIRDYQKETPNHKLISELQKGLAKVSVLNDAESSEFVVKIS
jgi:hypothetical protein